MLGLTGRRGIRRYVVVSWGGTGLDRARKVGADAKAPWTCVCSRYGLLKCTLLDDRPYKVPVAARAARNELSNFGDMCQLRTGPLIRGSWLGTSIVRYLYDSKVNDMGFISAPRSCGQYVVGREFTMAGAVGWPPGLGVVGIFRRQLSCLPTLIPSVFNFCSGCSGLPSSYHHSFSVFFRIMSTMY
jgi:hypothetical protein